MYKRQVSACFQLPTDPLNRLGGLQRSGGKQIGNPARLLPNGLRVPERAAAAYPFQAASAAELHAAQQADQPDSVSYTHLPL